MEDENNNKICMLTLYNAVLKWLEASTKAAIYDAKFSARMTGEDEAELINMDREKDWPNGFGEKFE